MASPNGGIVGIEYKPESGTQAEVITTFNASGTLTTAPRTTEVQYVIVAGGGGGDSAGAGAGGGGAGGSSESMSANASLKGDKTIQGSANVNLGGSGGTGGVSGNVTVNPDSTGKNLVISTRGDLSKGFVAQSIGGGGGTGGSASSTSYNKSKSKYS